MKIRIIALAVLLCAAPAAAGEAGFGLDLESFKEAARQIELPAPPGPHNGNKYFSRDCARLELGAGEGSVMSKQAELFSQEFVEDCVTLPPNELGLVIEHCRSRPLREWTRTARLLTKPRAIPSGKKEVFEVCLEGRKLELEPVSAFYAYAAASEGETDVLLILTPVPGTAPGRAPAADAPKLPAPPLPKN